MNNKKITLTLLLLLLPIHSFSESLGQQVLAKYPQQIQTLFSGFDECVSHQKEAEDLQMLADFFVENAISTMIKSWKQQYCDANKNVRYEYIINTKSIDGAPLLVKQIDVTSHSVPLLGRDGLIVGGHQTPEFTVTADQRYKHLNFSAWSSNCVPFVFEIDPQISGVYYIASLCREGAFHFKYYKHQDQQWSEIKPEEFPKERALENLWHWRPGALKSSNHTPAYIQRAPQDNNSVFTRERLIVIPASLNFITGLTARMWAHIESGVDFWQFDDHFSMEEAHQHAKSYIAKYSIPFME